jgi:hypothetical protein
MTEGPSEPDSTASPGAGEGRARPGHSAREQVTQPTPDDEGGVSAHPPTEIAGSVYPPTVPTPVMQPQPPQPPQSPQSQPPQSAQSAQSAQSYMPTQGAQPYQPTELSQHPYQPTEVSRQPYQPTQAVPPQPPADTMQGHQLMGVDPPQPPRADPQGPVSWSNPTIIARKPPASFTPPQAPASDRSWDPTSVAQANRAVRTGQAAPSWSEATSHADPPTSLTPGVAAAGGFAAGGFAAGSPAAKPASNQPGSEVLRYGPGVPPSQAGVSAEQVWRTGQVPNPPRRPVRVRRLASTIVTVILLVAAGVLLFLRFHHAPFHVTGTPSLREARNGCTVNVTGEIPTNGASGTISYQWVFTPQQGAPQPLSQSVVSGQHSVFVTVAVQGQGQGTATQRVTLQVLGPNQESASTVVTVSC